MMLNKGFRVLRHFQNVNAILNIAPSSRQQSVLDFYRLTPDERWSAKIANSGAY